MWKGQRSVFAIGVNKSSKESKESTIREVETQLKN